MSERASLGFGGSGAPDGEVWVWRNVDPSVEDGRLFSTTPEVAELVVRAVNAHDDLLAALKDTAEMCGDGYVGGDPSAGPHLCWCFEDDLFVCRNTTRCQAARAAVAKAEQT